MLGFFIFAGVNDPAFVRTDLAQDLVSNPVQQKTLLVLLEGSVRLLCPLSRQIVLDLNRCREWLLVGIDDRLVNFGIVATTAHTILFN